MISSVQEYGYSHGAPTLYNTCSKGLFGVIKEIWPQAVDRLAEMEIWTTNNLWGRHRLPYGFKDLANTGVVQLALEQPESIGILIFFVRYMTTGTVVSVRRSARYSVRTYPSLLPGRLGHGQHHGEHT